MKKYYYSLFAAATMLLATTSCSSDEEIIQQSGEMTTFKVELDGASKSRTAGDGQTVNMLYYAVYNSAGTDVIYPADKKFLTTEVSDGKATVSLPLMKSEQYDIVFWAQKDGTNAYSFDELNNITVNYTSMSSNMESRDAFFNALNDYTADGNTKTIELRRPFAQLNVATSKADWEEATRLYQANGGTGDPVKSSAVTISNLATTFNALTGEASGSTEEDIAELKEGVTFSIAGLLKENDVVESIKIKKTENGTATEEEYKLLAMNYLLMAGTKAPQDVNDHVAADGDVAKATVEVNFTLWKDDATEIVTAKVPAAPIQRNYRTNILGNFLTGDATHFNIVVDADFDKEDHDVEAGIVFDEKNKIARIYSGEGLKDFAAYVNGTKSRAESGETFEGWTVYLENDIDLNNEEWTPIGSDSKKMFVGTFDGKSKTVSNFKVTTKEGYAGLFGYARAKFKNLTVDGVTITANHYAGGIVGQGYCRFDNCHAKNVNITLTIKDKDWGDKAGGIIGQNCEGTMHIKGCTAENVTIKGYRDLGGIAGMVGEKNTVSGCSVKNVTIEQDLTNAYKEETQTTLAGVVGRKGANVTCEDNTVGENVYIASTADEVLAAMLTSDAENISVKLLKDTEIAISDLGSQTAGSGEYKLGGENTKNITIDLNNYKLTITTTYWSSLGAKNADALFTIKNGTMTSSQESGTWNSYDLTFANCNYAINNVTFDKAIAFTNTGKEATLANVAINETHDYYAMWVSAEGQTLNIDGLTIDSSGRGIKIDEQYVDAPAKVTMNIKNSTFKTANKAAILVKSVEGAEINAENLNIAEVAADPKFAVWVDEDAKDYADKVVVNGAYKKVEGTNVVLAGSKDDLPKTEDRKIDTSFKKDVVLSGNITVSANETNANSGYGATGISVDNGAVLDGNGKTLTVNDANGTWDCVVQAKNGTIKNLTVKGAMRGIFMGSATGDVYIDNVIFKDVVYTFNSDGGNKEYGVYISNCTINGWTSHSDVHKEVVYTNCKFGKGSGYAFCRPYGKTVYKDCEFSTDMEFDTSITSDITFENCTYGGVKITAENAKTLKTGDKTFFYNDVNGIIIK